MNSCLIGKKLSIFIYIYIKHQILDIIRYCTTKPVLVNWLCCCYSFAAVHGAKVRLVLLLLFMVLKSCVICSCCPCSWSVFCSAAVSICGAEAVHPSVSPIPYITPNTTAFSYKSHKKIWWCKPLKKFSFGMYMWITYCLYVNTATKIKTIIH